MMVIPAIDIMGGNVVRLRQGDPKNSTVYGSDPLEFAKRWESDGADMLHIVDLDATLGLGSNADTIELISRESKIPIEIAGGLRSIDRALEAAKEQNRIIVGTMALTDRDSLLSLRDTLGPSRVVVSLDHRKGSIVIRGWTELTDMGLADTMDSLISEGITEFMLTDVNRDGMMTGPELDLFASACTRSANVIASGGITSADDIAELGKRGASGVILGRAIYEKSLSLREARDAACR